MILAIFQIFNKPVFKMQSIARHNKNCYCYSPGINDHLGKLIVQGNIR